jgi:hypothetical protein
MNVLVTRMALAASVALATVFVAAGANAQAVYAQRDRGEAYDAQMNPQYRLVRACTFSPTTWSLGTA